MKYIEIEVEEVLKDFQFILHKLIVFHYCCIC